MYLVNALSLALARSTVLIQRLDVRKSSDLPSKICLLKQFGFKNLETLDSFDFRCNKINEGQKSKSMNRESAKNSVRRDSWESRFLV